MMVTPSGRSVRSIRQRLAAAWALSEAAICAPGMPAAWAAAAAARRLAM